MAEKEQAGAVGRNAEDIRVLLMTAAAAVPERKIRRGPPPSPPHLIVRPPRSESGRFMLYIYDAGKEVPTGFSVDQRDDAETVCDLYKLQKGAKERGIVAPRMVPVVAALAHLLDADKPLSIAAKAARLDYLNRSTRLATLGKFFAKATFGDVTTEKCKAFIEWRITLPDARYAAGNPHAPPGAGGQRPGGSLRAQEGDRPLRQRARIDLAPEVYLPKAGPGRTRWLRPAEIDPIYWAIRGRIWDHATGGWKTETVADEEGNVVTRRVLRCWETRQARRMLRRLVFIGYVSGTRNTAMRQLRWLITDEGGCFDLEAGLIHRWGFGLDPSVGKPRASSRISPRTVATLGRWRRADRAAGIDHVLHKRDGTPYLDSSRHLWRTVMEGAGLGADVVPHTLRHTAATMLRIAGVNVRQGADLLGMAVQTMVHVYGQWTLAGQEEADKVLADTRSLRRAMPLLSLIPSLPQRVVMAAPANGDATRPVPPARRGLTPTAARSAVLAEPKAPKSPVSRLRSVA